MRAASQLPIARARPEALPAQALHVPRHPAAQLLRADLRHAGTDGYTIATVFGKWSRCFLPYDTHESGARMAGTRACSQTSPLMPRSRCPIAATQKHDL
jgi:hypothetical protein